MTINNVKRTIITRAKRMQEAGIVPDGATSELSEFMRYAAMDGMEVYGFDYCLDMLPGLVGHEVADLLKTAWRNIIDRMYLYRQMIRNTNWPNYTMTIMAADNAVGSWTGVRFYGWDDFDFLLGRTGTGEEVRVYVSREMVEDRVLIPPLFYIGGKRYDFS